MKTVGDAIHAVVRRESAALASLASRIHAKPELAYKERDACDWQVALLKRWGFKVQRPYAGLPTAFRASFGHGRPAFCLMSEYDALPDIGHACGHNLIAGAALGAAVALAERLREERLAGTLVVMGTPAEESGGGKVRLISEGALTDIDAVLMAHASFRTIPDNGSSAISRFDAEFTGKAAHAAALPEAGLNALDAVMLVFQGVNAWRQQLPESSRIHGIVTDGGVAPNIIPERAVCSFYVRSPDNAVHQRMIRRFKDIVRGAALMTGTRFKLTETEPPYMARRPNRPLNEAYVEAAGTVGLNPVPVSQVGRASSDFGDVSQVRPGSHVYFGIAKEKIALHSVEFREAAGSAYGRQQMLKAAEALARVGYRFFNDSHFRREVLADFHRA
jgi:amidohydrolase